MIFKQAVPRHVEINVTFSICFAHNMRDAWGNDKVEESCFSWLQLINGGQLMKSNFYAVI
jgi:hypothetical protein